MKEIPVERRLFPRPEAAYYLGISLRSLDSLAANGEIPQTPVANKALYDKADLDEYVERVKRAS